MRGKSVAVGLAASTGFALPNRIFDWVARRVESGNPAATLDRFFRSVHVKDLRAIIVIALGAVLVVLVVGLPLTLENEIYELYMDGGNVASTITHAANADGHARSTLADAPPASSPSAAAKVLHILVASTRFALATLHVSFATLASFFTFFGPTLAAFGALVAWAYQTGSARLGVVDLFACEISTLCRVTTVLDAVTGMINRLDTPTLCKDAGTASAGSAAPESAPPARDFTSPEP